MLKNIRKSYKKYADNIDNFISLKEYLNLTSNFNKFIINKVLEGEEVVLPARLGILSIKGKKQVVYFNDQGLVEGLAPDWSKTKKLWESNKKAKESGKMVYHLNEHTDGFRYRYLWSKKKVLVKNKTLYSLRLTRENKRAVSVKLREGVNFLTI